ncbi:Uncharacterised protein [Orientia tsutsugamushi]|uniref:Uncharacterized protein n=2 Tax=Orientia tsutsugamushi TaxID=784 RepID=A0A2R8F2U3_ORITS|nr:putative membrane protein [Orientia tsutsugamushi str. TA716]SPM45757.1 Uncharacterised protein [Orientia tsutsugamushi]
MVKNNKDLLYKAALLASITQTIVLACLANIMLNLISQN